MKYFVLMDLSKNAIIFIPKSKGMKSLTSYILLLSCVFLIGSIVTNQALAQIPSNPTQVDSAQSTEEHIPGSGARLIKKKDFTLSFSTYLYTRYLNQQGIEGSYTDAFGRTFELKKRNDLQFQKVVLYFKGWLYNPDFRYMLYAWTSNANQGQDASVVIAGNLHYKLHDFLELGVGIGGIPTTRSMLGQWPNLLRQDVRPIAEEFFRGSFTAGIWAQGKIAEGLFFKTMLGNNLSYMGIDASQLDDGFDTWGTAFMYKTRNYGRVAPFGDFEKVEKLQAVIGPAYTRSNETSQSQAGTEAPENTQIRLSDGTRIFSLNAFADSTHVLAAKYQMAAFFGGIKYKGFSLDGEYYLRWISDFEYLGQLPFTELFDKGYTIQASAMLIDKTLQLYGTGSYINGEYGKPWEIAAGLNYFIRKNKTLRINSEVITVERAPVGYLSYPTVVGATGTVFMANLELYY